MDNIPGFPPLQRKKKSKKSKKWTLGGPYFAYFGMNNTDNNSGNDSGDGGGVDFGGDAGGGMGESVVQVNTPPELPLHDFGCLMLNLTPATTAIVKYWARKFIPEDSLNIGEGETVEDCYEDTPHVTVKYGVHTDNPEDVAACLDGYGPVLLKFGKIAKFSREGEDVIHIEVDSNLLTEMNRELTETLQCTSDFQEYRPHITLAFVKSGTCDHLLGNDFFNILSDTVSECLFAAKTGDEYFVSLDLE